MFHLARIESSLFVLCCRLSRDERKQMKKKNCTQRAIQRNTLHAAWFPFPVLCDGNDTLIFSAFNRRGHREQRTKFNETGITEKNVQTNPKVDSKLKMEILFDFARNHFPIWIRIFLSFVFCVSFGGASLVVKKSKIAIFQRTPFSSAGFQGTPLSLYAGKTTEVSLFCALSCLSTKFDFVVVHGSCLASLSMISIAKKKNGMVACFCFYFCFWAALWQIAIRNKDKFKMNFSFRGNDISQVRWPDKKWNVLCEYEISNFDMCISQKIWITQIKRTKYHPSGIIWQFQKRVIRSR